MPAEELTETGAVAASRWLKALALWAPATATHMLTTAPEYLDLTPTQYQNALVWLQEVGLVDSVGMSMVPRGVASEPALLEALLLRDPPAWLPDADVLVRTEADVPLDLDQLLQAIGLSPLAALESVRRAHGKYDSADQMRVGAAGEEAFMVWAAERLDMVATRVSEFDDGLGYDLLFQGATAEAHVEVKTTSRADRSSLFISRNEFEQMNRDSAWCLQFIRLDPQMRIREVCWVPNAILAALAPADSDPAARWQSIKVDLRPDMLRPGLADLFEPHKA